MANLLEIKKTVKEILDEIFKQNVYDYGQIKNFYEEGYLDSVQMMELILCLEEKFDIEFPDDDLLFENFMSFDSICEIILKKTHN